ncbi:MAG: glycosyltransferase family 4 protein [Planctomycetota bacterium]|nr:glycosyltransferase family 4 protein [Planctomycetota bacterium]
MNRNVLHIDTGRTWRGGQQQVFYLTSGLVERGVNVILVCPPGSPLAERAADAGIKTVEVVMRSEFDICAVISLRKLISKNNVQLVHAHTAHAHALAAAACTLTRGTKCIVTRRVDFPLATSFLSRLKYSESGADHFITVSAFVKKVMVEGGVLPERISVVHSGVDMDRFRNVDGSKVREEFPVGDAPLLGQVGSFVPEKGHRYSILAMKRITEYYKDAKLLLPGEGALADQLHELIEKENLTGSVIMPGFRHDMEQLMCALDVFLMPSSMEGLGTAALDAMAVGVPVVATNCGGLSESVIHERTGFVVEPKNSQAIADAVLCLLRHENLAENLRNGAFRHISENFSAQSMIEGNLDAYERVLTE